MMENLNVRIDSITENLICNDVCENVSATEVTKGIFKTLNCYVYPWKNRLISLYIGYDWSHLLIQTAISIDVIFWQAGSK